MSELLDRIEDNLNEIESKVLFAFRKLLTSAGESGVGQLSAEFRGAMRIILKELHESMDQSGSREQLTLTTEKHEELRTRLYVIDQLLDRKIPMGAFNKVDTWFKSPGRTGSISHGATAKRGIDSSIVNVTESGSAMDFVKSFFGRNKTQPPSPTTGASKTRNKPASDKTIYRGATIYSAAPELAMLARVVGAMPASPGQKEKQDPAATGKAVFKAKDLSSAIHIADAQHKQIEKIAKTPEELREKLKAREDQAKSKGKATFAAKDPSGR